jgi:HTH-type transcriptional regulator/antitoxin HigA
MATSGQIHSNLAIPPGEYLAEVLDELGMSQAELARRTGRPAQAINEIVHGEKAITPQTALQFEQVLRIPAHIWISLEAEYQLARARNDDDVRIAEEAASIGDFPYADMARFGWVEPTRDRLQKVRNLRRYFGVSSLAALPNLSAAYGVAFRRANAEAASPKALAAWLRAAEDRATAVTTRDYDPGALGKTAAGFRALTRESPDVFLPALQGDLAAAGAAFVLLPHLPKTYANGATFWLSPTKAVIAMTLRGSWADIFWFSLFHEIGHVLLHDKRSVFVEGDTIGELASQEAEADRFARDLLVPAESYASFVAAGSLSASAVISFADEVGIAPGIVVGRLQREGLLKYDQLTRLKVRYALGER